jgi:hypothetical protein
MDEEMFDDGEPVEVEIDGVLDLHSNVRLGTWMYPT